METLSPKGKSPGKLGSIDHAPPIPPKEMIGNTLGSPHYQKFHDSLSAAYTNYQVYRIIHVVHVHVTLFKLINLFMKITDLAHVTVPVCIKLSQMKQIATCAKKFISIDISL